ncbi:hypothetical protein N431DRAFT_532392 [Stipitochalara longipes BDJ]|nr:hypothetical protein N431DRAFT_532392 [Stipitochalara longipes BDJ]
MEFALFPKLASELRDMIWGFALPGPRTITIEVSNTGDSDITDHILEKDYKFKADSSPIASALLHTCARSRLIALHDANLFQFEDRHSTLRVLWSGKQVLKGQGDFPMGRYDVQKKNSTTRSFVLEMAWRRFLALEYVMPAGLLEDTHNLAAQILVGRQRFISFGGRSKVEDKNSREVDACSKPIQKW